MPAPVEHVTRHQRPGARAASAFADELMHERDAMRRDLARVDGLPTRRSPARDRGGNRESGSGPSSGRISTNASSIVSGATCARPNTLSPGESTIQPPPSLVGQRIERRLRRRVPAGGKRFRDRRRLRLRVRRDGVQDRRLAHARLADEDGALAAEQRAGAARRRVAPTSARPRSPARQRARAARGSAANPGWSDLFAASTNRQPCASAPMIQRLTSSSSTAMSGATTPMTCVTLAAISFSLERVGAVEERGARLDRLDRSAAGHARDTHPVAAGERRVAALQHALDAFRRCRGARRSAGAGWR